MFLIDLGVPRNFDERLNEIENIYLYDIDDLDAVAQKSLGDREREAEKAEQIVAEEIDLFLKWLAELRDRADHQGHPRQHGEAARSGADAPSRMAEAASSRPSASASRCSRAGW